MHEILIKILYINRLDFCHKKKGYPKLLINYRHISSNISYWQKMNKIFFLISKKVVVWKAFVRRKCQFNNMKRFIDKYVL